MGTRFKTTRWSIVLAAGEGARPALSALCEQYWGPLYEFVKRRGHGAEDAKDLTQGFIARLLEKNDLASANPARGRFRSWLLGAAKHYLANEWDKAHTLKRGGAAGEAAPSDITEPADGRTPDYYFQHAYVLKLLDRATERLRGEFASRGREELFERIRGCISRWADEPDYSAIVREFGMKPGSVRQQVSRLRDRWADLVQEEVAETVERPEDVPDEIRELAEFLK